jgi:NAD(P)-dependent dehydrogenase (short-subunit alcohol dehydrogenase family)
MYNNELMKHAVILGAQSGLAQQAVKQLQGNGYQVYACDIQYQTFEKKPGIIRIPIDVTDCLSLEKARKTIEHETDSLDLFTSFAGQVTIGSLIELPARTMQKNLDLNVNSLFLSIRNFFPLLEKAQGRIIIISSEYGKIGGIPFHGYYGAAKHAVEIYADSLRREISKTGVSVTKIRPGAFQTPMQSGIQAQFDNLCINTQRYRKPLGKMKHLMQMELTKAAAPSSFGKAYMKAVLSKRPPKVICVHNSLKMKLLNVLPSSVQDWIFGLFF